MLLLLERAAAKAVRSESLANRAREQLQRSHDMRSGTLPSSQYSRNLQGGTRFPTMLRSIRKEAALASDGKYLEFEADKLQVSSVVAVSRAGFPALSQWCQSDSHIHVV